MKRLFWTLPYWFFSIVIATASLMQVGVATGTSFADVAPHLAHYLAELKVPLYLHIALAPFALALAPFQFWQGLRTKHPRVHRTIGYTYVISIAIAGVAVFFMLPGFKGTLWAATGFATLAIGWLAATGIALYFAKQRNFVVHRRWMMRSAALTFAAVTLRLEMIPMIVAGMSTVETYNVTAWLSWLPPLLFVEWWLRRAKHQSGAGGAPVAA